MNLFRILLFFQTYVLVIVHDKVYYFGRGLQTDWHFQEMLF